MQRLGGCIGAGGHGQQNIAALFESTSAHTESPSEEALVDVSS